MNPRGVDRMDRLHSCDDGRNDRSRDFVNDLAERCVLLRGTADDRKRPDRVTAVIHMLDLQHGKWMPQTVIAQVIAKRAFRFGPTGIDGSRDAEVRIRVNRQRALIDAPRSARDDHPHRSASECRGEQQFRQPLGQRHHGRQCHGGGATDEDVDSQLLAASNRRRVMHADAAMDLVVQTDLAIGDIVVAAQLDSVHSEV